MIPALICLTVALAFMVLLVAFLVNQQDRERETWRVERQELNNRIAAPGLIAQDPQPPIQWEPAPPDPFAFVGSDIDELGIEPLPEDES